MFFYLSFLRPPPHFVPVTSRAVTITPQIANDLRTETYEEHTDIWYSWVQDVNPDTLWNDIPLRKQKLTRWRGSESTYKPIPVPLPSPCKVGDVWRLVLWTHASNSENSTEELPVIRLAPSLTGGFGESIIPVISAPISIRPKATKEGGKQESIDRHYWLPAVGGDVPSGTITGGVARGRIMAITERTSFDLDKKVWDSGLGLSAWLADLLRREQAPPSSAQELRELLLTSDGLTAVELGAGVGVVSLLLAAMLEPFPTCQKRHLLATDLSSAVPLIEQNVAANCHHFESSMVEAATLDWEAPISACASLEKLDRLDLVIMSDVTYNRDVFPALLRILIALLHLPEASTCTRILMGYKERDPAERDLWELAKNAEIEFENVGLMGGMQERGVEIWIGRKRGLRA